MKAAFLVPFEHALPTMPDAEGRDRLTMVSRLGGDYPLEHGTCLVVVEADEAAIAEMEANPEYVRVEVDLGDDSPV